MDRITVKVETENHLRITEVREVEAYELGGRLYTTVQVRPRTGNETYNTPGLLGPASEHTADTVYRLPRTASCRNREMVVLGLAVDRPEQTNSY